MLSSRLGIPRLIPAYAGKTLCPPRARTWERAHPRVCGENWMLRSATLRALGSSPRMRGKRSRRRWAPNIKGLIPAYAGKTSSHSLSYRSPRAHPRVCGENCMAHRPRRAASGLIPAYAGKTFSFRIVFFSVGAHPRVCGENRIRGRLRPRNKGSSPRMRGKPHPLGFNFESVGLIPAYAGKT